MARFLQRCTAKGGGMCDYSLGGLPNRLAVDGEELIVHKFPTQSIGLASSADLQAKSVAASGRDRGLWDRVKNFFALAFDCSDAPAVCVPPGASLILKSIPPGSPAEMERSRRGERFVRTDQRGGQHVSRCVLLQQRDSSPATGIEGRVAGKSSVAGRRSHGRARTGNGAFETLTYQIGRDRL